MSLEKTYVNDVRQLHFELSSFCNADCVGCLRLFDYNKKIEGGKTPEYLSMTDIEKIYESPLVKNLRRIFVCGNNGDPLVYNNFLDFIELSLSMHPNAVIGVHTNGGVGSRSLWSKLGQLFRGWHRIKFSIDGLEDTNSLYRRNVSWDRLMENVKCFIDNGGQATWKFIEFQHNHHQIEQARELSKKMGFAEFELRKAHDADIDVSLPTESFIKNTEQKSFKSYPDEKLSIDYLKDEDKVSQSIQCLTKTEKSYYIDSHANVWPCCWVGQEGYLRTRNISREWFYRKVIKKYGETFNSLKSYSFDDIVSHQWFSHDLVESWQGSSLSNNPRLPTCRITCGKRSCS